MHIMSKYLRLTHGLTDKGILIKPEDIDNYINNVDEDWYASVYYYNEEQLQKFKETGSVKNIKDVITNKLIFDLDSENNLEEARQDSLTVISRLNSIGISEKNLEIYFSGQKGFTIVGTMDKFVTPEQLAAIAIRKIGKGIRTLDPSVYNASRILRVPNTRHQKSGLYKTLLTFNQLQKLKIESIKKYAEKMRPINFEELNQRFVHIDDNIIPVIEELKQAIQPLINIDLSTKPNHWKDYKWSLLQGNFKIGQRHMAMMTIAATCRALGYDRELTKAMCLSSDAKHCGLTQDHPIEDLDQKLDSIFSISWEGGQYSYKNSPELQEYCIEHNFDVNINDETEVVNISEVYTTFKDFVVNIDKNTIKTGIPYLDKQVPITTGMNLGLVGSASSGKTSIALEVLKNTSMNGVCSVIASLDMHRNRLFEKLLYKVSKDVYGKTINREELYEIFQSNQEQDLVDEVKKQYENVYFYDRSRPSVKDIYDFIVKTQKTTGKQIKLLMVDYFERIGSDVSDPTASSLKVANELQDLINDLNIAVVTLVQPNKFSLSGGPDAPILSYTAIKGSSFLYQSFRAIISIWRPFFTPKTKELDKFLEMAILKNDLGELDHKQFNWEGKTGTISEMYDEDYERYEKYQHQKKQLIGTKEDDNNWN